jgi:pimeloyl-ACP methyl ester carboxylesterase
VICAQYGLDTNVADVAATIRTFNRVHDRILLVGHSYGGAVITAAGTDDRVAGLVYINALGPDETETSQAEQDKFPKTPAFGVAWRTKPSWYIVGKNDQAVHPDLERAAAKRMGVTTYEFDSSHCPMLSQPDNVLDVIRTAAAAI